MTEGGRGMGWRGWGLGAGLGEIPAASAGMTELKGAGVAELKGAGVTELKGAGVAICFARVGQGWWVGRRRGAAWVGRRSIAACTGAGDRVGSCLRRNDGRGAQE